MYSLTVSHVEFAAMLNANNAEWGKNLVGHLPSLMAIEFATPTPSYLY